MKLPRLRRRPPDRLVLGRPSSCHCWGINSVDPLTGQVSLRGIKHRPKGCPYYKQTRDA